MKYVKLLLETAMAITIGLMAFLCATAFADIIGSRFGNQAALLTLLAILIITWFALAKIEDII